MFVKNVSIETPPLTPDKPARRTTLSVRTAFVRAMAPPIGAANPAHSPRATAAPASATGTVALGHTECDVTRGIGAPDNVSLSNRSARRARCSPDVPEGATRRNLSPSTAGRLSSIERAPEVPASRSGARNGRRASRQRTGIDTDVRFSRRIDCSLEDMRLAASHSSSARCQGVRPGARACELAALLGSRRTDPATRARRRFVR